MELRERRQLTETDSLKDKLKVKWHNRDFSMKKEDSDKITMRFFFVMIISLFVESIFFLIPYAFAETRWLMSLVVLVLTFETGLNWHRSYYDTGNYVTAETKKKAFPDMEETERPDGWKNCIKCQVDAPPRSHHCNFCGKCILKRIHHCFLTGSCIGFENQRFFFVFCLWSLFSSAFAMYLQLSYLNMDLPLDSADFIAYIPPVTLHKLLMGYITLGQAFIVSHFFICVLVFMVALFFFLWHILIIVEGVTSYEAWHGIFVYQCSRLENISSVFGSVLYVPAIIVFPYRFEQPGDGITWKRRSKAH